MSLFASWFDTWFGVDKEIAKGKVLDARIDELNRRNYEAGKINPATGAPITAEEYDGERGRIVGDSESYAGQVAGEFTGTIESEFKYLKDKAGDVVDNARKGLTLLLVLQAAIAIAALWLAYKWLTR